MFVLGEAAPEGIIKTNAVFNTTIQLKDKGIKYLTEITKRIFPSARD